MFNLYSSTKQLRCRALRRSFFFYRDCFELQDICLVLNRILADSRATGTIIGFVLGIMGNAKSHFSRSPFPASFSSTLNVRFHGPLGDVIARSRVFRFSNTLETTRNEGDNFWCSLFTYFFFYYVLVRSTLLRAIATMCERVKRI